MTDRVEDQRLPTMQRNLKTSVDDPTLKAYFERKIAEYTWTGERYDENRPLEELAALLQAKLAEAVAQGELPGPAGDYRVTVWAPVPRPRPRCSEPR